MINARSLKEVTEMTQNLWHKTDSLLPVEFTDLLFLYAIFTAPADLEHMNMLCKIRLTLSVSL